VTAYDGKPLTAAIGAAPMVVAAAAREGRLVICAGAGLSVAEHASLPSGQQLGRLLDQRLRERLHGYTSPADTSDLLAVADAAVAAAGGLEALQYEVIELADFDQAWPNYGHRALALLLSEGAARTLLLWNWDNCVERAALEGERLEVARTLQDVAQLRVPSIAKIHGCITRVPTLLITSAQLADPPLWTDAAFTAALRGTTGVFIGIGDVADYARRRLEELKDSFPDLDVYVVSPSIASGWGDSVWAQLLPELEEARRVETTADEFLDEVARAWALELPSRVRDIAAAATGTTLDGINRTIAALSTLRAIDAIAWARTAAFRCRIGQSAIRLAATQEAVAAMGVLAGEQSAEVQVLPEARCRLDGSTMEVLVACEMVTASQVEIEAHRRAERLAGRGLLDDEAHFLVSGAVFGEAGGLPAVDVLEGAVDPENVLTGPRGLRVTFTRAPDVLARAA